MSSELVAYTVGRINIDMPQLRGGEQETLYTILVEHIDPAQLSRVLKHNGLPELEELVGNGNHRDRTQEVVDELSKRFKIVELVDGAIAELDESCPPLQSWIATHREELVRKRDRPTAYERIEKSMRGSRPPPGCLVVSITVSFTLLLAALLPVYKAFMPVGNAAGLEITDLRFIESEEHETPDGQKYLEPTLKLDVQIVNRSPSTAVLSKAKLNIEEIVEVTPWTGTGSVLEPSATYLAMIPVEDTPPFFVEVSISHSLKAEEADRFHILLRPKGAGWHDYAIRARLQLVYNENQTAKESEPFVFTLGPDNTYWDYTTPMTAERLRSIAEGYTKPAEAYQILESNKGVLPELRKMNAFNSTQRFQQILKVIEEAPNISELKDVPLAREDLIRHARRAFFVESFASLIHPELVPAVFEEIRKLGHVEFDSEVENDLVSQYERLKGLKLEWLKNEVIEELQQLKATQGTAMTIESSFLLPAEIRVSEDDRVKIELDSARDEVEFIYGKLNGENLEDAIVETFVRGTMNGFLRKVTVEFEDETRQPEYAVRFVERAIFPNLGLFANSRSCLEQALSSASTKYRWMEPVNEQVSARFTNLVQGRIQWINRALNELEDTATPVAISVPDSISVSLDGASSLNQLLASPNDRRSMERELELLTIRVPAGPTGGRANTTGNESPFSGVIVRYAAMNILSEFRQSTKR